MTRPISKFVITPLVALGFMGTILPAMAQSSDSMGDKEVYKAVLDQSSNTCKDYSGAKAEPDIRKIPINVLRPVYEHQILLCPNTKLADAEGSVIWYGNHKAMIWNPETSGAADTMNKKLGEMAHDDSYPSGIEVWTAKGDQVKGGLVPAFDVSCMGTDEGCNQ